MTKAYHYQHTFNDELAQEFRGILSVTPYAGIGAGLLLCGDSITSANMSKGATTAHKENNGIITTLNARLKQRFKLIDVFDQGVGGETAQTRTGLLTDYSTVVARHLEIKAAVEAYGRNDISAGRSAAEVVADRQTIITHLLTLVDIVFVESIKPSDYASQTVEKNQIAETANATLQAWCEQDSRLYFVDTYSALGDENGLESGNSYDDIHLTVQGAWRASSIYLPIVTGLFGVGQEWSTSLNDLALNPNLTGNGGSTNSGTSGEVADNWDAKYSGSVTDITRIFSKTAEGKQRIVITAGVGAGADEITYFQQTLSAGYASGEVYRARVVLKVNSMQRGYWLGTQIIQRDSGQSAIYTASDYDRRDADSLLDNAGMAGERLHLQPMDFIIQADTASIDIRIALGVSAGGSVASMDVEVEQVALERVDLNLLEELGDKLAFWMNPDATNAFIYDDETLRVSQINDQSYAGNHATLFGSHEAACYNPSAAEVGNFPALQNAGVEADTTFIGYRFPHSLTLTTPRTLVAVARGDVSLDEPDSESASNALFAASNGVDTGDSLGAIRQVRDDQRRHQMTGYAYGSSYSNATLDALRSYWLRYDGTDIDGGVNNTISEGPSAAVTDGLVQDGYGYIFTDGDSSDAYLGWARDLLLFDQALSTTELHAVLTYIRNKSNVTAD